MVTALPRPLHKEFMKNITLAFALLASSALAQTFPVRGDIDAIQGTNLFELDCTRIRLVSTTVNLQILHDASRQQNIEYDMMVTDVSAGGLTILNVLSATAVAEQFNMGNLRFGRSETWDLSAPAGTRYGMFINVRNATSLATLGLNNPWFLGPNAVLLLSGTMPTNFIQVPFTMPTIPSMVGVEISAQTVLLDAANNVSLTHLDCKDVRAN